MHSNNPQRTINIIGAGPAGLCAAISAAQVIEKYSKNTSFTNPVIQIWEKSDRIGQTILKTGNGRCNFSNTNIIKEQGKEFNNPQFFNKVYTALKKVNFYNDDNVQQNETNTALQFFSDLGLLWDIKNDGMMFPKTNKANTVLDVLRFKIEEYEDKGIIKVNLNSHVSRLNKDSIYIVCTGPMSDKNQTTLMSNIHLNAVKPYKILGPIKTNTKEIKSLDGIKVYANVKLSNGNKSSFNQNGEVLFRKYGLSGIVVFNASRFIEVNEDTNFNQCIALDFIPEMTEEELTQNIYLRINKLTNKNSKQLDYKKLLSGMLLPNISEVIGKQINDNESASDASDYEKNLAQKIAKVIKNFSLEIKEIGDEKQCQVTRGGISTEEIDPTTMKANNLNNIYLAGEIVDIDGPCGGYNLHWAWTSGLLAGISAAKEIVQ